ncbi:MAG: cation:proton antiporter, partial [Betaproteobacteria bacterium]|nr:cation:proton antiporter [Betaproteobacteria bacterium]
ELLQIVLFLLLCAVALGWVARHFNFPYPIALVIGGGALSFVPNLPHFPFDPQFILVLVLPPILYQAALLTSWRDFKANIRPIGLLAIGLVIVTTLAVGAALKMLIPECPWGAAFVLGAIISPPDAVAATAILSRLNIPRRVVVVLEGESLVNDASGLVIYKFAVAAVLTGAFSLVDASVQFVGVAAGGIVLAVVAAGMVRGRYAPEIVSAEMRIIARSVWNMLVFLLNSLIFMLIGIQLSEVVARLSGYSAAQLCLYGVLISVVAITVRFAWIYPATYLPRVMSPALRAREPAPAEGEVFIMSWCGMRGIVSLAAALALPIVLANGEPFPQRDLIIFLTFVVIAVTLVVQGLSLPPLIRRLKVGADWSLHEEHQHARMALGAAALAAIDELAQRERMSAELAARVRAEFADKIERAFAEGPAVERDSELARRLRQAAIQAERRELIRIWRESQISDDILHHIEEDLDYQESHI